jgi:hypothetical protein
MSTKPAASRLTIAATLLSFRHRALYLCLYLLTLWLLGPGHMDAHNIPGKGAVAGWPQACRSEKCRAFSTERHRRSVIHRAKHLHSVAFGLAACVPSHCAGTSANMDRTMKAKVLVSL